jgi:hypothetical protein
MNKAFICGVSKYDRADWSDLWGVDTDLEVWASTLNRFFPDGELQITGVIDRSCTRQAILDGLGWLADGSQQGDWVYFVFGGHGAQFVSKNLDGTPRKLQETLVPYDFSWERLLSDEELGRQFASISTTGATLTAIFDCCHAGGMDRAIPDPRYPVVVEYPREIPVPEEIAALIAQMQADPHAAKSTFFSALSPFSTTIYACAADEKAWDTWANGEFRGVFSFAACQALEEDVADSEMLISKARSTIFERGFKGAKSQNPSTNRRADIRPQIEPLTSKVFLDVGE